MKIVVVHGQAHKRITYTMTKAVLDKLVTTQDEVIEFFLPKDGPDFCYGCNNCFLNGEQNCPSYSKMQPIAKALEEANIIILGTPNYVMEMNGAMKNLMDHFAYRWITHRPHGSMFTKVGITVCSSAGAPARHTARSLAKQLKWMGVSKVYCFPLISNAMNLDDLKEKKKNEIDKKAMRIAKKVRKRVSNPHPSLRGRLSFSIFRKMQSSPNASWNPTDRDWWINQGWTKKNHPW